MPPHAAVTTRGGTSPTPPVASVSTWQVTKRGIARGAASAAGASSSSSGYTTLRVSEVMNARGDFNGTCTREEAMTITPETPDGSCTSYFPDVTDYCCAAVGGIFNSTFQATNVTEAQAMALDHPICSTSNYADMLSCYQYVTETHCSSTSPVPYGVCNKDGQDTSRSVRQISSAARGRGGPDEVKWLWKGIIVAMIISGAVQAMAS